MNPELHLSDEDLTLALDGELAPERAAAAQAHLAHCWACRARQAEFQQAVAGYMQLHAAQSAAQSATLPPGEGPAALLQAHLALRHPAARARWAGVWVKSAASAVAGVLLLLVPVLLVWFAQRVSTAGPLPDARLTPGATRLISREQICSLSTQDEGRRISPDVARRVFALYRIERPKPRSYEVDYLISPALGGADDLRNLWPLPYDQGVWTSRVKDALEDHLRERVCAGAMELSAAQWEIASNWIAAYKKHFRTARPLAAHALFVKDSPWE